MRKFNVIISDNSDVEVIADEFSIYKNEDEVTFWGGEDQVQVAFFKLSEIIGVYEVVSYGEESRQAEK